MLQVKPMSTTFESVAPAKSVEPVVKFAIENSPLSGEGCHAKHDGVCGVKKEEGSMSSKPENKLTSLWLRLKKIKHIEIYAVGILVIMMLGIYISSFDFGGGQNTNTSGSIQQNNDSYARDMESRLESTLSQIRGAGRVQAMVTVVGSSTIEIAYSVDERTVTQGGTNGNSTTTTTIIRTPVLTGGRDPIVIMTTKPRVIGVVIVSQGANDPQVRMQLLRSVQALIQDNSVRIEIVTGR